MPSADAPADGDPAALRALQLAHLGPRTGDLVWDIGAGSGAAAVEAARFGAAVIAVDLDAGACGRIEASARKFGVQVQIVHGAAPQVLEDLPEPDVVRLGAGCGADVVAACVARRPERIAASAVNRDEAEAVSQALEDGGYRVERALLQAVELDSQWGETERAVAFALCGHRQ